MFVKIPGLSVRSRAIESAAITNLASQRVQSEPLKFATFMFGAVRLSTIVGYP